MSGIIDMSAQLNEIRKKHGKDYYFSEQAHDEAAAIWGFFRREEKKRFRYLGESIVEVKSCKAEVRLAESSTGLWLMGCSADTAVSGFGFSPGVFDPIGYDSYENARFAGVQRIKRFFQAELICKSGCNSESNKRNIAEALRSIEHAESEPELDFFSYAQDSRGR